MREDKVQVQEFWDEASCGEDLYLDADDADGYRVQAERRYLLEPYIPDFAEFGAVDGCTVLEIGVGMGADHERFVKSGAKVIGVDLTLRAVRHTRRRLSLAGLSSCLLGADAESLCFADESFARVYSWGVLHHSPETPRAIDEVWRVLEPGGSAHVMIYNKWSLVGLMLWARYGALRLQPWIGLDRIYSEFLESPGTKAYTADGARALFAQFREVEISTVLTHGDLLESQAGQRHEGHFLSLARWLWPRALIRRFASGMGLFMLIKARK